MRALTFRRAALADVPGIVALVESTYRGEGSRTGWTTEVDLLDGPRTDSDEVRSSIEAEGSCVVLGFAGDALVACANVRAEGGAGFFGMFSVVPSLQRAGLGKLMLAEAERIARDEWQLPVM